MRFIGSAQMDKPPFGPGSRPTTTSSRCPIPGHTVSWSCRGRSSHTRLPRRLPCAALGLLSSGPLRDGDDPLGPHAPDRYAVIAGSTLTWTLLANTWVLPLQGLAVARGSLQLARLAAPRARRRVRGRDHLALRMGLSVGLHGSAASGYDTAIRLVPWNEHTPPLLFLLFLLPTIALIVLGFASGSSQGRRLALLWLCSCSSRNSSAWTTSTPGTTPGSTPPSSGGRG